MKKNLFFIVSLLFSITLFSQNITQWRGKNRDGKYPDKNLLKEWPAEGPKLLWHFDELGEGHSSVAPWENYIFISGTIDGNGYIFKFTVDGNLVWKKSYGKEWVESWPGVRSTPLIVDGQLYMLTGFGKLFSMNADDGGIDWTVQITDAYDAPNIRWAFCENLAVDGDKLFVTAGGKEANVLALNKNDGSLIWKSQALGEKSAYGSPALITHNGRKLLVAHTEFSVIGLDARTGEFLWSHEKKNRWAVHPNTPLYHDGQVYVVSGYGSGGKMLELNADGTQVTQVWENISLDNQMGGVVLLDGYLYGGGHNSRSFFVLDWKSGEEVFSTKEIGAGNIIYADGLLYFYDEKKGLVNLIQPAARNTKIISKFKVPYGSAQHWAHLVINNQRLYVRHGNSLMGYSIAAN